MADLRDHGAAVVLTTHELVDLERLADRIAIVRRGRLVALGTPADIVAGIRRRLRFRVAGVLSAAGRGELAGALAVAGGGGAMPIAGSLAAAGAGGPGPGTASTAPGTLSPAPRIAARPTIEEDGPGGAYRLEGLEPTPRVIAALADWCRGRDLLLTEMRAAGGTLEERFLELVADDAGDAGDPGDAGADGGDRADAPGGPDPRVRARAGGRDIA